MNHLRPMLASGGALAGTGWAVQGGRRMAVAGAADAAGQVHATASATCLLLDAWMPA